MMSSALPNGAVRYQAGTTTPAQSVDNGDAGSTMTLKPPPARPLYDETPRVAGLYTEYDASTNTETLSMSEERGSNSDGGITASQWIAEETQTDSNVAIEYEHTAEETADPYELLLMPGAGLPRNSYMESDVGLRHRGTGHDESENRTYPDGRHLARLGSSFGIPGAPRSPSQHPQTVEPSIEELYDNALQEGDLYLGETATPTQAPGELVQTEIHEEAELEPLTVSQILGFSLPALGAVLADPLMSLVDTACVGQMSSVGLAALGPNTTVFGFVGMAFSFFTTATVAMCARAYSRGEIKEMGKVVSDGLLLAIICGVACAGVLLTGSTPILNILNTGSEIIGPAKEYLFWRALALPFTLISMVGAACCLGQRDSATPLRVAGISGLVNLVVDLYLVIGPPQMGIAGAAIATAGSQVMAAALYYMTIRKRLEIKFRLPYWSRVKPFVTAGVVLTLRSVCIMSSISLMTAHSAALGTTSIAAHQVVVGLLTLAQFCPEPISQAAQTFLATTAGALRKGTCTPAEKRYTKQAGRLLMGCGAVFGAILAAAAYITATHAPHVFTSDPVVMAAVINLAPQLSISVMMYACVCCLDGLIFASGDMVFASISQVVNLTAMVVLLKVFAGAGLGGIWVAFAALCALRLIENATRVVHQYI